MKHTIEWCASSWCCCFYWLCWPVLGLCTPMAETVPVMERPELDLAWQVHEAYHLVVCLMMYLQLLKSIPEVGWIPLWLKAEEDPTFAA